MWDFLFGQQITTTRTVRQRARSIGHTYHTAPSIEVAEKYIRDNDKD